MNKEKYLESGATISDDGLYRYKLWRKWKHMRPCAMFIGLNPSTADADLDDPTIRKCVKFAKAWGYGGIYMLNLFAYRATNPEDMKSAIDPVGTLNDSYLKDTNTHAGVIIAAWGNHGSFEDRDKKVKKFFQVMDCLGENKNGSPKHPLYIKDSTIPKLYSVNLKDNEGKHK